MYWIFLVDIPVGSPEIVALGKQQRQPLVAMHCRRLVQFAVQPEFGLGLEHLAMHLEFERPFCEKYKTKLAYGYRREPNASWTPTKKKERKLEPKKEIKRESLSQ